MRKFSGLSLGLFHVALPQRKIPTRVVVSGDKLILFLDSVRNPLFFVAEADDSSLAVASFYFGGGCQFLLLFTPWLTFCLGV